jgi:hypothetical protein
MAKKCQISVSKYGTSDVLMCSVHGQIAEFSEAERNDTTAYQAALKIESYQHVALYS